MKRKEIFTVSEFMAYTSNDLTIVEKAIGHIRRNKKAYMQLVFIVAVFLIFNSQEVVVEALGNTDKAMQKVDKVGGELYKVVIGIGNLACGLSCVAENIKEIRGGNPQGTIKITFNYLTLVAIINSVPFMIKTVASMFNSF